MPGTDISAEITEFGQEIVKLKRYWEDGLKN